MPKSFLLVVGHDGEYHKIEIGRESPNVGPLTAQAADPVLAGRIGWLSEESPDWTRKPGDPPRATRLFSRSR